jgi:hypothetical protein
MNTFTQAATGACAALLPNLPLLALVWATIVFGTALAFMGHNITNGPRGITRPRGRQGSVR